MTFKITKTIAKLILKFILWLEKSNIWALTDSSIIQNHSCLETLENYSVKDEQEVQCII